MWRYGPTRATVSSFLMFLDHAQQRTTDGRTPLNMWSAHRRYIYVTTYNTHKRQMSVSPAGFESTIPVKRRQKAHTVDRATTGVGIHLIFSIVITYCLFKESVDNLGYNLIWLNDCWIQSWKKTSKEDLVTHIRVVSKSLFTKTEKIHKNNVFM
jgi:hypothetical protein